MSEAPRDTVATDGRRPVDPRLRKDGRGPTLDEIFGSEQAEDRFATRVERGLLRRLFVFVRPYWRQLAAATVLMAITSAAGVAAPNIVGVVVDVIGDGVASGDVAATTDRMMRWLGFLAVTIVVGWVSNRARLIILAEMGTRVVVDIRGELFTHLQRLSVGFYDN